MNYRTCETYREDLIALLSEELEGEARAALQAHLEGCPGCRDEYRALAVLAEDLEAIGQARTAGLPEVDLVDAVLSAVRHEASRPPADTPRVVPFERPARRADRRRLSWSYAAAGMAAAAVLVLYIAGYRITRPAEQPQPTTQVERPASTHTSPDQGTQQARIQETQTALTALQELIPPPARGDAEPTETMDAVAALTIDDVLTARREALTDPESREQIAQWASLTADKARAIINDAQASDEAKAAAAEALPPDERTSALAAAANSAPANSYLRYRLATAYAKSTDPERRRQAVAELDTAVSLDPQNALFQYELAAQLFQNGDMAGALAALDAARQLEGASAYSSDAALNQQQALMASGLPEDMAGILAAFTAGSRQYAELVALGEQLLQYGQEQEALGQVDIAQQIYEAVNQFGSQVTDNATYSGEALAGLDIQNSAIEILSGLVSFLQQPQNLAFITESTTQLAQALTSVGEFFQNLDGLFQQPMDSDLITWLTDSLLQNGDLGIFEDLAARGQATP